MRFNLGIESLAGLLVNGGVVKNLRDTRGRLRTGPMLSVWKIIIVATVATQMTKTLRGVTPPIRMITTSFSYAQQTDSFSLNFSRYRYRYKLATSSKYSTRYKYTNKVETPVVR
jgi:hypothetical protein